MQDSHTHTHTHSTITRGDSRINDKFYRGSTVTAVNCLYGNTALEYVSTPPSRYAILCLIYTRRREGNLDVIFCGTTIWYDRSFPSLKIRSCTRSACIRQHQTFFPTIRDLTHTSLRETNRPEEGWSYCQKNRGMYGTKKTGIE